MDCLATGPAPAGLTVGRPCDGTNETDDLLAQLRENRQDLRDLARDIREDIFEARRDLENPHLTAIDRAVIEQSIFDQLQTLKEVEERIADSGETITNLRQSQDTANRDSLAGTLVAVLVIGLILALLLAR